MDFQSPLKKTKDEYKETVDLISMANSAVGIDAQYTHAIIIEFLKQISARLEKLEKALPR
ncbi:MAG: hypothetical protein A2Z88_09390 [Omnitrophica WOR_2 bacterium GWA2_47_8]|nr:MAG: hypothetical protein A2Z88_09390 [Omnitrophica WOR_2 bacterium GWA2_47_8]